MKFKIQAVVVECMEQNSVVQRETETSALVALGFLFS